MVTIPTSLFSTHLPLDHIGIAVHNIDKATKTFSMLYGGKIIHKEDVANMGIKVCFMEIGHKQYIELLEPIHNDDNPISKFLSHKGEGLHHIAFRTDNLKKTLDDLTKQNIYPIHKEIKKGAWNKLIAFLHPKHCHGVLIELCQKIT